MTTQGMLVSAGEASGDRIAALALSSLGTRWRPFGLGGTACQSAGMEMLAQLTDVAAMGWIPVLAKSRAVLHAFRTLTHAARARRPRTALLVGFTSFNQALGKRLRAQGIRVLWCVAPQVWAWRPSRLRSLRASIDALAVILPFEEPLWRSHGYDAHYVGHPAVELTHWRGEGSPSLVVLPGSRDQEARAIAVPMLRAARKWSDSRGWPARCLVAQSLSSTTERWLIDQCDAADVAWSMAESRGGAAPVLHEHTMALCASGTASLEAALAGVPPVVGYRCDPLTALIAKRLLLTPHIALPNVLLGERAFPELVQRDLSTRPLMDALDRVHRELEPSRSACRRVRTMLEVDDGLTFGGRLAAWIEKNGS